MRSRRHVTSHQHGSVLWILFASITPAAHLEAAGVVSHHDGSQMKVEGTIVDVGADLIVVNTPTTNYTLNKTTAPLEAKIGDKVTLWVTSSHVVIDEHRQATGQRHRSMIATLLNAESRSRSSFGLAKEIKSIRSMSTHLKPKTFRRERWLRWRSMKPTTYERRPTQHGARR